MYLIKGYINLYDKFSDINLNRFKFYSLFALAKKNDRDTLAQNSIDLIEFEYISSNYKKKNLNSALCWEK